MKHEDFQVDLMQQVRARLDWSGDTDEGAFVDVVTEYLSETGDISDFDPCFHQARGIKVNGSAYLEEEATLDLFVADYDGSEDIRLVVKTNIQQVFKRVENFFQKCSTLKFLESLDMESPVYDLAKSIHQRLEKIRRVRFFLLTDAVLSDKVKEIPARSVDGRDWTYRVWDLNRLSKIMGDGTPEEIVVDFTELFGGPLCCLPATLENDELQSYLTVIPGDWLAAIYDRFAGRLLEQNVRTFLQLKGKVNKGIRQTILAEPDHFFAYNNGISATAEEAESVEQEGIVYVHKLRNFQIVNGGQTTASLYHCFKRDKAADLERVKVQMKLTVVMEKENVHDLVPKISRFANSQNKISNADFFSTHPFHVRLESISRRLWAPAVEGSQMQTHWFYERARGQHANAMAYLTPAKKDAFLRQNPRAQVLSKTDVAKYFNTFEQRPNEVSRGAEKSFGVFAEHVGNHWKDEGVEFSDDWYQRIVAKAIVFRTVERLVQTAEWYTGGYRANLVTYGIALLLYHYELQKSTINLKRIWLRQTVNDSFPDEILPICQSILARIVEAAAEYGVSNVTEWCKKPACWDDIKRHVVVNLTRNDPADIISDVDAKAEAREGRQTQKFDNEIEALSAVYALGAEHWKDVLDWCPRRREISPKDLSAIRIASVNPEKVQTFQARRLLYISSLYKSAFLDA